jgi:hypothetical protein
VLIGNLLFETVNMKTCVLLFVFALGLAGLAGCSSSTPTPKDAGVAAPPPGNSGADANAAARKGRPAPPPK